MYTLRGDGKRDKLATFELDPDGTVSADWDDDVIKDQIERNGIHVGGKTLTPLSGKDFFDALDLAYSSSSRIVVVET